MTIYQYAASAIVKNDSKYLLIQRGRNPFKGMYAFPGGTAKPNECIEDTLIRELEEETGLTGYDPVFFSQYLIDTHDIKFKLYLFRVNVNHFANIRAGDDAAALGWYTVQEAFHLPLAPNIKPCLKKLASFIEY